MIVVNETNFLLIVYKDRTNSQILQFYSDFEQGLLVH